MAFEKDVPAEPALFQIHWSLISSEQAGELASPDTRLLALWPAPVNHDVCFESAGFTQFADNDEAWDRSAETLLRKVMEALACFGPGTLLSQPLQDRPPWYLRLFRPARDLPLQQQALLPMQCDSLPPFRASFGDAGAALQTGDGHFLLWIHLPDAGPDPSEFIAKVSRPWTILETSLRWSALLPDRTGPHKL